MHVSIRITYGPDKPGRSMQTMHVCTYFNMMWTFGITPSSMPPPSIYIPDQGEHKNQGLTRNIFASAYSSQALANEPDLLKSRQL
jgi:hypothetical protein